VGYHSEPQPPNPNPDGSFSCASLRFVDNNGGICMYNVEEEEEEEAEEEAEEEEKVDRYRSTVCWAG